jgi:hypothetical protein
MAWAAARSRVSYITQQFGQKVKINVNATGQNKGLWFKISPFCKTCKDHSGKSTLQTLAHTLGSWAIERGIS